MVTAISNRVAYGLFPPISDTYERGARLLSLGQDERWRREMVGRLELQSGARVVDIAAGTGSITRRLADSGAQVISVDLSESMLRLAVGRGAIGVVADGARLPFEDGTFDAVAFGYLLRYAGDVKQCMGELTRVLRPAGRIGMVEFGRPKGAWRPLWWLYTRFVLPGVGLTLGRGWLSVGRFLGPSIDDFADRFPPARLVELWKEVGLQDVGFARPSLGGGLVMWGRKE